MAVDQNSGAAVLALECIVCNAEFYYSQSGKGRYPTFCSLQCKKERQRTQAVQSKKRLASGIRRNKFSAHSPYERPKVTVKCEECGSEKVRGKRSGGNRFCSKHCYDVWHRRRKKAKTPRKLKTLTCPTCNAEFKQICELQRYCCKKCKQIPEWSEKNHRRRAKTANGVVNPYAVFARDAWRCQICHRKTLKLKRGSTHPRAPELDHIIPLSRGGAHAYKNCQCACRKCNGGKGAKTLGQLHLFSDPTASLQPAI